MTAHARMSMQVNKELLESLLLEEESATLDFKQDQYPFANATDEQKSELLKDVLAFTNAFRRSDAFILIGVKDVKGGRKEVVGISEHIDDANLQQFVNSKTQRPVTFSYIAAEHDGLPIAVIYIPRQFRPVYSKARFGKVEKGTVYLRRGSSTGVASPEEIAQMGAERTAAPARAPLVEVMLIDPETGASLGTNTNYQTLLLETPPEKEIPDYQSRRDNSLVMRIYQDNTNYYRQLVTFTKRINFLRPVYFAIKNTGETSAHDVRFVFELDDLAGLYEFVEEWDMPEPPQPRRDNLLSPNFHSIHETQDVTVERIGETWRVEGRFGKIQPHQTVRLKNALFVGAGKSGTIEINGHIFADNLPRPRPASFALEFEVEPRSVSLDDIETMERERFFSTPEGSALLDELGKTDTDTD